MQLIVVSRQVDVLPNQWRQVGQQAVVRVSSVPHSLHHHVAFRFWLKLLTRT